MKRIISNLFKGICIILMSAFSFNVNAQNVTVKGWVNFINSSSVNILKLFL